MQIELSNKEFRRLLDLVYMGNWVLNSTRGEDRFQDYDDLESKLFGLCRRNGMGVLGGNLDVFYSIEVEQTMAGTVRYQIAVRPV